MNYLNIEIEEPHVRHIPIDHLEVSSASNQQYLLRTTNDLLDGIGIILYDQNVKVGGIAHVHFNRIVEIVDSEYDCKGKLCRESFRAIKNPNLLEPYLTKSDSLLNLANSLGGKIYDYYLANLDSNYRTKEENEKLKEIVESYSSNLMELGFIRKIIKLNEHRRVQLDLRTGDISPFVFNRILS